MPSTSLCAKFAAFGWIGLLHWNKLQDDEQSKEADADPLEPFIQSFRSGFCLDDTGRVKAAKT